MGYGKRALKQLKKYYEGKFVSLSDNAEEDMEKDAIETVDDEELGLLNETIRPRKKVPTLLKRLHERRPENIDYIGTSYGLTQDLLKFWKRQAFVPVYLSQKSNDLTGEHSCIMISALKPLHLKWLSEFYSDFRRRILRLVGKSFTPFTTSMVLSLLDNNTVKAESGTKLATRADIEGTLLPHELRRIDSYTRNQVEFRLILDLTYDIAFMFFQDKFPAINLDAIQKAILIGVGLQHKTVDTVCEEFNMPSNQILAKFYDAMKKISKALRKIMEAEIESELFPENNSATTKFLSNAKPLESVDKELDTAAKDISAKQKKELEKLKRDNLSQFAIKGDDDEWNKAIGSSKTSVISVKSGNKRTVEEVSEFPKAKNGGTPGKGPKKFKKLKK